MNAPRYVASARAIAVTLATVGHLVAVAVAAQATAADRGGARRLGWSVELGAARATPFVEDGNGVSTRAGWSPFLGAELSWALGQRMSLTAGVRGSTAALRVESASSEWRAGTTQRYDVRIGLEAGVARYARVAVATFVAHLTGPDDVIPFRGSGGRISVWGAEAAGYRALGRDLHVDLLIAADVARFGSQPRENPPLDGGWVGRLRLGVRHGFR